MLLRLSLDALSRIGWSIKCYENAMKINPSFADACDSVALARVSGGKLAEAIDHRSKALDGAAAGLLQAFTMKL